MGGEKKKGRIFLTENYSLCISISNSQFLTHLLCFLSTYSPSIFTLLLHISLLNIIYINVRKKGEEGSVVVVVVVVVPSNVGIICRLVKLNDHFPTIVIFFLLGEIPFMLSQIEYI